MVDVSLSDDKIYKINEEIVSRDNQDGTVVLMKMDDSEIFYKIEGVAASVWKEMKSGKEFGKIKTEILDQFNVSEDKLNEDLKSFISDLISKNIVE